MRYNFRLKIIFLFDFQNISPSISSTIQCSCWENVILFQEPLSVTSFLFVLFPLGLLASSQHLKVPLKFHSNVSLSMFSFIYYILPGTFILGNSSMANLLHCFLITSCPMITFQAFVAILLWRDLQNWSGFSSFLLFPRPDVFPSLVQFLQLLPTIHWCFSIVLFMMVMMMMFCFAPVLFLFPSNSFLFVCFGLFLILEVFILGIF